ncbi:MAG: threonine/serine dehydratase [Armatimonadota bacterium]|nr:threonine/serine dehydratase [Armatimonadota bacterium]MDR7563484.1 threonine/serine dehydratase [Armatimonadota bacterium]MDR7568731.1 threonine/serine dehydratase [Armatimonadota bacterium]MDR7601619.1 threonine/serine dehydratase [Armatimonadota bacterium]
MDTRPQPGLLDVLEAARRIEGRVVRTPLVRFWAAEFPLYLKLESLQVTGSFKPRGVFNHLLRHREACARGVVTASSGNHGQALTYAARQMGLRCAVVVPEDVVPAKLQAIERLGAEVIRCGRTTRERIDLALRLSEEQGLHYVPPFDDPDVIAGQGTIGLEILDQCPEVERIYVPCGGGGLLSGIAVASKAIRPEVRLVGVEPEGAACFFASWQAGGRVRLAGVETVADGLRAAEPGELPWAIASRLVDAFTTVTEHEILSTMRRLLLEGKLLTEPSGAVSVAASLREAPHSPSVAVVSGGNVDPTLLSSLLSS